MSDPWYEVGKWSIDANMSPLLDKLLTDFTGRISDELFQTLSQEIVCILDCSKEASSVRLLDISCPAHESPDLIHHVYAVVFREGLDKLSPKAALGEVAHQFAHLALRVEHGIHGEIIPSGNEMADALAISWGFEEEIKAYINETKKADVKSPEVRRSRPGRQDSSQER